MKLFINEIIIDERIRKGAGHITELIDDIRENGQITPITVRIDNSGNYHLVAGYRRMMAMKALEMNQIEAYVIPEADEEKLLQLEISENEIREGFTRTERMNYIRRLDEIEAKKAKERMSDGGKGVQISAQVGKARDAVADQIGISHDTIAREKKIIEHKKEIDPEDFKNWDEGKLSTNKVFKALQSRLRFLEAREKEEYAELAELKQQAKTPQVIEKVPDDYEKLKSQVADFKHSEKILREDKEKLAADRDKWERLYKESGRVEPTLDEQAKKDMDYLTVGINAFLRNYGSKAWSLDRRVSIPDHFTKDLQAQVRNLYAFAQNLYEMTKGDEE